MLNVRRLPRQASRYVRGFAWLMRESLRVATPEWRHVVMATFMFLAGNAALLSAIFLYIRLLERNQPISFLGLTVQPQESLLLLGGFIATVMLSLTIIAVSDYTTRASALRIHRRYQEESTRTALRLAKRLPDGCAPGAAALLANTGLKPYYSEYPRSCGWTMRFIANAFPALTLFSVAFCLLLWLDPGITLLVFLLGLLLVAAQYPASLFAAHASNVLDDTRTEFNRRLQGLAARIDASPPDTESDSAVENAINKLYDAKVAVRYQNAQQDRYRALELSALTMQVGGAIALTLLLFLIVGRLLTAGEELATLAVYATLLRQLLGNATNVFRAVTAFSRFFPHINAFRTLVEEVERNVGNCRPPPLPKQSPIRASSLQGCNDEAYLRRGEIFHICTRSEPGRLLAVGLQSALLQASPLISAAPSVPSGLPAIQFFPRTEGPRADPAAIADALCNTLEHSPGILLIALDDFAQLDVAAKDRLAVSAQTAALGLISGKPPKYSIPDALVLVHDPRGRWYWVRAGAEGLSEADQRKIRQRLRNPHSTIKGGMSEIDTEPD